jgi:hypothetical protein
LNGYQELIRLLLLLLLLGILQALSLLHGSQIRGAVFYKYTDSFWHKFRFRTSTFCTSWLVLPLSEVERDRKVSQLNNVKNEERNIIKSQRMNSISEIRVGLRRKEQTVTSTNFQ